VRWFSEGLFEGSEESAQDFAQEKPKDEAAEVVAGGGEDGVGSVAAPEVSATIFVMSPSAPGVARVAGPTSMLLTAEVRGLAGGYAA
jgi:hypothetical protein